MTKKARLIYNPVSGHEQMLQNVADILNVLEQAGFGSECLLELRQNLCLLKMKQKDVP